MSFCVNRDPSAISSEIVFFPKGRKWPSFYDCIGVTEYVKLMGKGHVHSSSFISIDRRTLHRSCASASSANSYATQTRAFNKTELLNYIRR